jgi:hypothetical protein
MELLVERDCLPKSGPGHIDQRRNAIDDAFLNYVMSMLLESYANLDEHRNIPGSFVVLMRRQLSGENPDLYQASQAELKRLRAAEIIADRLVAGEKITIRRAAMLLNISRTNAERLLASKKFQSYVDEERQALLDSAARLRRHGRRQGAV